MRRAKLQERWERWTGKQKPSSDIAPVTHSEPRQVLLKALPGPDIPLIVGGGDERWSFRDVMECGAEFTYLRLVKFDHVI